MSSRLPQLESTMTATRRIRINPEREKRLRALCPGGRMKRSMLKEPPPWWEAVMSQYQFPLYHATPAREAEENERRSHFWKPTGQSGPTPGGRACASGLKKVSYQ